MLKTLGTVFGHCRKRREVFKDERQDTSLIQNDKTTVSRYSKINHYNKNFKKSRLLPFDEKALEVMY